MRGGGASPEDAGGEELKSLRPRASLQSSPLSCMEIGAEAELGDPHNNTWPHA